MADLNVLAHILCGVVGSLVTVLL